MEAIVLTPDQATTLLAALDSQFVAAQAAIDSANAAIASANQVFTLKTLLSIQQNITINAPVSA